MNTPISELEKLASKVKELKNKGNVRRPIIIEFCGSPKAGKTTTLTSLNIFLKRNGFETKVISERAYVCPVKTKTDYHFNIWTMCAGITELIEYLEISKRMVPKIDVILIDRGVFDSICWFEWLNKNSEKNPHLNDANYKVLIEFATMDIWTSKVDLIYVFQTTPKKSIEREFANLLTKKRGSIMRESILENYNSAIESTIEKYGSKFRDIEKIETNEDAPDVIGLKISLKTLDVLNEMLVEKIGFFESTIKNELNKGLNDYEILNNYELKFNDRMVVENDNFVQPVPIAVLTNKTRDKIFVVKKNNKNTPKKSAESNKLLVYVGGHVRKEDKKSNSLTDIFVNCLNREILEELKDSLTVDKISPYLIYDPNKINSAKHLAIVFVLEIDVENKNFKLDDEEFVVKKGKTKSGSFYSISEIQRIFQDGKRNKNVNEFEFWSQEILKKEFNLNLQDTLF